MWYTRPVSVPGGAADTGSAGLHVRIPRLVIQAGEWRKTSSGVNRAFPSFFFAALRTRSSPLGPLSRLGVRRWLDCPVFSSVSGLPSTTSADGLPPLFGCFIGTTPLYDSPALKRRAAVHVGLIAHRLLPPARLLTGCGRQRGLSVLARGVSMHAWGLGART